MGWTEERVELLRKLWTEGLSASQIARQMGGVTRNAVIGKVHRLGLSGRATSARVTTARINTTARARSVSTSEVSSPKEKYEFDKIEKYMTPVEEPTPILSAEERASVLHLTEHTCKWPIGDPGQRDFHFCGARAGHGSPYCQTHTIQAYQPLERRRKKTATND